jgi:hypothetical protein
MAEQAALLIRPLDPQEDPSILTIAVRCEPLEGQSEPDQTMPATGVRVYDAKIDELAERIMPSRCLVRHEEMWLMTDVKALSTSVEDMHLVELNGSDMYGMADGSPRVWVRRQDIFARE